MPDWSEFDERWRVDDERRARRREQKARRRRARRRGALLVVVLLVVGAGAAYALTKNADDTHTIASVTTVHGAHTTADGRTVTTATVVTTKPKPKPKPLTPIQKQAAFDAKTVDAFARHNWFLTQGGKRKKEMALTFDDGPGPYTDQILRILRAHHAKATFFQIGQQIPDFASVVRKQLKEGMVLGDHTEGHIPLAGKPRSLQREQIVDQMDRVKNATGQFPVLFRPPTGVWDRNTRQLLKRAGLVSVFWTIDTEDYQRPGTQRIVDEVLSGAKPGAIVLMHDGGGDRTQTVAALPAIIKGLQARGYKLVTIPQLLHDAPPKKKKPAPFGQGPGL